jgi:hypothetical protein
MTQEEDLNLLLPHRAKASTTNSSRRRSDP